MQIDVQKIDLTHFAPIDMDVESVEIRYNGKILFSVDLNTVTGKKLLNFSTGGYGTEFEITIEDFEELLEKVDDKFD